MKDDAQTAAAGTYPPSSDFVSNAHVDAAKYDEMYARSISDPEGFWADEAQRLDWMARPTRIKNTNFEFGRVDIKWFEDGVLNVAYNCVDRHLKTRANQTAIIFEPDEPGDPAQHITYAELYDKVNRMANVLLSQGVMRGDRVVIYLPMIPEAAYAMLACARIGAIHSIVFAGFSPDALANRINDCGAKIVITADTAPRGGRKTALKSNTDAALLHCSDKVRCLVVKHTGDQTSWIQGRDVDLNYLMEHAAPDCPPRPMNAEDPLFILYTSGSTGKPKGVVHSTGGYLVYTALTHEVVFDYHEGDVYWCTADVGWITGHSYITYGPTANGATQVLYEGTPDTPHKGRWWEIIADKKVSLFYTAPTAIRTCMKWGEQIPAEHDLSSLRILGTVGESINPEAYVWYRENIGGGHTPIVDTWWQTETGAHMITPLPGITAAKPGSAMTAFPGIAAEVVDDAGTPVGNGEGGYLVITEPWPSMLRTIWGDDDRYKETYWSRFEAQGYYFAGDGAKKDDDGAIWLLGRVDDVMNVSGHRLSTTEIESALVSHPKVAEAAVVGAADETTGQAVCAFVILRESAGDGGEGVVAELRQHVAKEIGPIAKPRQIMVVPELPKTRSGKIMRRLLRDVAENREVGDATTLADSSVMDLISAGISSGSSDED